METDCTSGCWGRVRTELRSTIGADAFKNWIDPVVFDGVEQQTANFTVPTSFIGTWVETTYGDIIKDLFQQQGVKIDALRLVAARQPVPTPNGAGKPAEPVATKPAAGKMISTALDSRFTFDNFVVGPPNELAHAASRRVAEGGAVSFNPLFLYGGVGLGKTHLMHAIAHHLHQTKPESQVLYLSAEQFMHRFVQALRFKDTFSFKEQFRSVDMLLIDDVQFIADKNSTQDEFFHTFNALVDQGKQIVISADRSPGEIEGLEERIRSRLQCGLVVDLHPTDYELRLGILHSKAESQAEHYPGIKIDTKVMEFMAHRISNNIRVLEGALHRLLAHGSLIGREINLDVAQDVLSDILRQSERKVTIEEIQRKVADHYNLRMNDMLSARRARAVARPRQMAMYLSKRLTTKSLPDIGRKFGGRDHTTVMHAVKRIEELKKTDGQIAEDLELLRRMLEA